MTSVALLIYAVTLLLLSAMAAQQHGPATAALGCANAAAMLTLALVKDD